MAPRRGERAVELLRQAETAQDALFTAIQAVATVATMAAPDSDLNVEATTALTALGRHVVALRRLRRHAATVDPSSLREPPRRPAGACGDDPFA